MTDTFRALCAELTEALDAELDLFETRHSALLDRARAVLAQPEPQGPMPEVDDILRLAATIREVDGNNDKGAAALAEAILSHSDSRWQHAQPEPQGLTDEEPTDQEIEEWADAAAEVPLEEMDPEVHGWRRCFKSDEFSETIRAALRRWGRPAIEPVPLTPDAAFAIGQTGGPPSEAERLVFEAWMRGHSWLVAGKWNGTTYADPQERHSSVDVPAMQTRMLWAAWRDRAALSRPAIKPVPVSERLPGPEDCDGEGRCWLCGNVEGDWRSLNPANTGVPQLKYCFSHWLPHWALPVPGVEGE